MTKWKSVSIYCSSQKTYYVVVGHSYWIQYKGCKQELRIIDFYICTANQIKRNLESNFQIEKIWKEELGSSIFPDMISMYFYATRSHVRTCIQKRWRLLRLFSRTCDLSSLLFLFRKLWKNWKRRRPNPPLPYVHIISNSTQLHRV